MEIPILSWVFFIRLTRVTKKKKKEMIYVFAWNIQHKPIILLIDWVLKQSF